MKGDDKRRHEIAVTLHNMYYATFLDGRKGVRGGEYGSVLEMTSAPSLRWVGARKRVGAWRIGGTDDGAGVEPEVAGRHCGRSGGWTMPSAHLVGFRLL